MKIIKYCNRYIFNLSNNIYLLCYIKMRRWKEKTIVQVIQVLQNEVQSFKIILFYKSTENVSFFTNYLIKFTQKNIL